MFLQRGEAVSESEMLVLEGWAPKSVPGWVQVVLSVSAVRVCSIWLCHDHADLWHLSSPVWRCAGSPILVMSGMCWWESPRT